MPKNVVVLHEQCHPLWQWAFPGIEVQWRYKEGFFEGFCPEIDLKESENGKSPCGYHGDLM